LLKPIKKLLIEKKQKDKKMPILSRDKLLQMHKQEKTLELQKNRRNKQKLKNRKDRMMPVSEKLIDNAKPNKTKLTVDCTNNKP
jgi:hypothetical protein